MSKRAYTGKARGRPKGKETDVAVLREDGTFEHKSRKEIPIDASSFEEPEGAPGSSCENAGTEESVGQVGAARNCDRPGGNGAQEWQQDLPDLEDPPAEGAGTAFTENSAAALYCNQLLSVCHGCLPPLLPAAPADSPLESLPEVTFCMPAFDTKKGGLDHQEYAMPGLCQVSLDGGGTGIAHWCNCCPDMELQKSIFSGVRHPPLSLEYLGGQAEKCIHLDALLMLAASLKLDPRALCALPQVGVPDGEQIEADDGVYLLPFVGEAPKAWVLGTTATECIVVVETRSGGRRCTHCYGKGKEKCWHVQKVLGERVLVAASQMTAAAFEARFQEDFDIETGKRKLKCQSRKTIPELHENDEQLAGVLRARGNGSLRFPEICRVEREEGSVCGGCGDRVENGVETVVSGTIFHLLAPVTTQVETRTCKCGKVWHYDGRHDAVLNFNDRYLFSYELLNW